jgi:hypothetical protein
VLVMSRIPVVLATLTLALALSAPAQANPLLPPAGDHLLTGLSGGYSPQPFAREVGVEPEVFGVFVMWNQLGSYVFDAADRAGGRLMLHISTARAQLQPEVITPLAIARGQGDGYLLRLNRSIDDWGKPTYIRFLAEMNQSDNAYAGFDRNGHYRGKAHAPSAYQDAFRRTALILRGGLKADINAALAKLHLPPVNGGPEELPEPQVAMVWVPQTRGTPDIPANMPIKYWPGPRYVDWIGTDFYSRYPNFHWLTDFYNRFKGKPFAFGEWGMWGGENPAWVKTLFSWVRSHNRVRMMLYNQGALTNGPFRLNRFPASRAEIRRQLKTTH